MPFVVLQANPTPPPSPTAFTTTVGDIIADVANDLRQQIGPEHPNLIVYLNRVSLTLQRLSRFKFLLSAPNRFITQPQQTDYWIGTTGSAPLGQVDTLLNITNMGIVKQGTVFDRSNFINLQKTDEPPDLLKLAYQDRQARPGRPKLWRNAPDTPNTINIYPAPDNQSTYTPQPAAPICTTTSGGSLPNRFYWVWATYVDTNNGESNVSTAPTRIFIPSGSLVKVQPPQPPTLTGASGVEYSRWNCYAVLAPPGQNAPLATGNLQNISGPLNQTTYFTEPTSGLQTGTVPGPTTNTLEPIDGYVIEFRYYQQRLQLTATNQTLQIPDDYKDIVTAGVNLQAAKYLGLESQVEHWMALYKDGMTQMIHDKNLFPKGQDFIVPDYAAVSMWLPADETFNNNWPPSP
jgi:hypothetical protein